MTPQNATSHLGLFYLHREISSKNGIKIKITPNTPKIESGLSQMIMMGKSILQIWVKHFSFLSVINVLYNYMYYGCSEASNDLSVM